MKTKQRLRGMLYFLAGAAVTLAVTFGFLYGKDARASSACVQQNLIPVGRGGDLPKPVVQVLYTIPSCFTEQGYRLTNASITNSKVLVEYKK